MLLLTISLLHSESQIAWCLQVWSSKRPKGQPMLMNSLAYGEKIKRNILFSGCAEDLPQFIPHPLSPSAQDTPDKPTIYVKAVCLL